MNEEIEDEPGTGRAIGDLPGPPQRRFDGVDEPEAGKPSGPGRPPKTPPLGPPDVEGPLANLIATLFRIMGVLAAGGTAAAAANLQALQQDSLYEDRGSLPDLATTLEAVRREQITDAELRNVLGRYGFSDRAQEIILAVVPPLLGVGDLLELLRREKINDSEFAAGLQDLGYNKADQRRIGALEETLPSVSDVILWAVREVFTPDLRARFKLDDDFPQAMLPYARRVGITDENARNYWAAHWQLPSIQLGFEALHRSPETGIVESDLDVLLRAQDVMPFWREPIKAIAFRPFTRVDVRRMHRVGVLDDEQLERAYRDVGYDEERAKGLAEFTKRLNETEDEAAIEPFRSGLRSRIQSLYLRGSIGIPDLEQSLTGLGYSLEAVQAFSSEAQLIREADEAEDTRQAVRGLFVKGFWSESQAMARLISLGFDSDEIERLFRVWELQRELRDETAGEAGERDLSKTDVLGAFREALIQRQDAADYLDALGYDLVEQEVLLDREEQRLGRALRERVERTTRSLYLAGRRTASDARTRLGEVGIPPERVEALLVDWVAERESRTPELTTAQIQRALGRKLLSTEQASRRLDDKGYSVEDRNILIALAAKAEDIEEA